MNDSVRSTVRTRTRLLKAAAEVFATEGIEGATTREIAQVAGVNEVTLFRHFPSKDELLGAVVQQVMALQQAEALSHQQQWTQDLLIDLKHYAWVYNTILEEHEALIVTFMGEAKRRPEVAHRVILEAVQPLREKLITYLRDAQERGTVRQDVDPEVAIDLFAGMLLSGMLRRCFGAIPMSYSRESYIESCVSIFVHGISTFEASARHLSQIQ
ncbi:MAG TPA: TetR/AcrR family transcriptional regulator [Coleofasciculaceae cyanobacterium]